VWLARSTATGVLRAAKIVWRQGFEDDRPFRREFEGLQHFERLSREHPSQLALFHIGRSQSGDYFYYVMELADDLDAECQVPNTESATMAASAPNSAPPIPHSYSPHTLRAEISHGRLPADRLFEIGLALTEALGHLHTNGLVHRDVKPSNVIFVNGRPKLADIGLVTDATDTLSIVGTEGYLPPDGPGTPQADLFALGKVLYEAATGWDRRQFPHLPPDLGDWPDAENLFEVNEILLKACAPNPSERYNSAEEMRADLALLVEGKSIRRKRNREHLWAAAKKAGLVLIIFAVVAVNLVFAVRRFTPSEYSGDGPPSTNILAEALCNKAMHILRDDNYQEFGQAYTNFNRAIELDPYYARPYVGLFEFRLRETAPGVPAGPPDELRRIVRKLSELAPRLAPTLCAQAFVNYFDLNYPEADRLMLKAIQTDDRYENGHTARGFFLLMWGRPVEARAELEKARAINPSKVTIYRMLAHTYYVERDFTNAIAWYRQALSWEPHHAVAYDFMGLAQRALGDYTNALDSLEKRDLLNGNDPTATAARYQKLRSAVNEGGGPGYWRQMWKLTADNLDRDFYSKAVIQIHLGDTNAAFGWLYKCYDTHERWVMESPLGYLLFDEHWDGLHDDPRFKEWLDRLTFTKVMPPRNG
jgi:tetratricopeptide (TPR) repeat protein